MLGYLAVRLLQSAATLLVVAVLTFSLMHAVPGGPFDADAGLRFSEDVRSAQLAQYGLDDPLPQQLGRFLLDLGRGDLGISLAQRGRPVTELVADSAQASMILGAMAFAIVVGIGLPLGIVGAVRARSAWDRGGLVVTTVLGAVPSFVLGFLLLLLFAVWLDVVDVRLGRGFGEGLDSLPRGLIPAFALAAPALAMLARLTRGALLDVLAADFVRTARAKGLSSSGVYLRHALRNALIPVVTVLGPLLAELIAGSVIIESMFGLPGIGATYVHSITQRDYGVIMGVTLFYAALVVAANLVVDLVYPLLDPRARLAP
jgi:oligopeptide transport system permease protein